MLTQSVLGFLARATNDLTETTELNSDRPVNVVMASETKGLGTLVPPIRLIIHCFVCCVSHLPPPQSVSQLLKIPDPAAPWAPPHTPGASAQVSVERHHGRCIYETHQQGGKTWKVLVLCFCFLVTADSCFGWDPTFDLIQVLKSSLDSLPWIRQTQSFTDSTGLLLFQAFFSCCRCFFKTRVQHLSKLLCSFIPNRRFLHLIWCNIWLKIISNFKWVLYCIISIHLQDRGIKISSFKFPKNRKYEKKLTTELPSG